MKYLILFALVFAAPAGNAQTDPPAPPYQRFPDNVPLRLLLADSSTVYTMADVSARQPFMVMLFSPDCEHCKKATSDIIEHIDLFRGTRIIMATPLPYAGMLEFYNKYELGRFPNITVGRDINTTLPVYYSVTHLPFLAFYGKKKKFLSVEAGSIDAAGMAERLKK